MNLSNEEISLDSYTTDEYIYDDIFSFELNRTTNSELFGYGSASTFLRIIFVFISRIGFILIQLGSIPIENIYRIIFYNVFEIANAIMSYIFIGYMLSFGKSSIEGWIGYDNYLSYNWEQGIVGISACLIGTGQISLYLASRIHLIASVAITILYCGFYQPVLIHWIWNKKGWMNRSILLGKKVSVKDHSGDLVIHLSSSLIGLIGAIFLGRRLIKIKDLDEHSMGRDHLGNSAIGYVFIILGYIAFSLPTPAYQSIRIPDDYIGIITINNMLALAAGIIGTSFLHLLFYKKIFTYWIMLRCIQGGLAGIVAVAAGVDIYSPVIVTGIAAVISLLFFLFSLLIHNTALEDYCNITSSHLISSIVGALICPILAQKENFETQSKKIHILWQFICIAVVISVTMVLGWIVFLLLSICNILRNKSEVFNHKRALTLQKHLPRRAFLERLFTIDDETEFIEPGEKKMNIYRQSENSTQLPGTNISQIREFGEQNEERR